MNMLGKLALAGVLTTVSVPALAHGRGHGHGHGRGHHGHRHDDRCRHDDDGRRDGYARGPVWVAPAPVRREVWVPGHWSRRPHGSIWIEASWVIPPQPSVIWVAPQWVWTGVTWQWQEGHWTGRS